MNCRVLVTAGPTREPVDAIRFLSNRSTGKMGFAVAAAAARRGHEVRLIAGPVALPTPPRVARIDVETAQEMCEAVLAQFAWCEVLIMAAAVADWRPARVHPGKLKKHDGERRLRLVRTPDILQAVAPDKGSRYLVGFAAEDRDVEARAARKLHDKHLDAIVANDLREPDAAFAADTNRVTILFSHGGRVALPLLPKTEVADRLLALLEAHFPRAPGGGFRSA